MAVWRGFVATIVIAGCMALAAPQASAQAFDESDQQLNAYVQGNLLFLTYHEVGHLLLDALLKADQQVARLSAEETADDIATWLMLPDPDEADQDAEILAAMFGWLDSAAEQDEASQNPHYPDDAERAARIACYLYGSDTTRYAELARAFRTAVNSVNCEEEYEVLHADLESWFGEYLVPPASADGGRIQVSYAPAPEAHAAARAYLIETGVLEEAAQDINQFIRLPVNVTLTARSCGGAAAEFRYNAARREITACYEAVAWFMGDAVEEVATRAAQGASDDMGSGGARVKQRPRPRPR